MRTRVFVVALVACSATLGAQNLQKTTTPISVAADPPVGSPGAPIKISGTSGRNAKQTTVTIVVTKPQGAPVSQTAATSVQGDYALTWTDTKAVGTYQIEARSPDGSGRARATFAIGQPGAILDQGVAATTDLVSVSQQAVDDVAQSLGSMPVSPPQQETLARVSQLKQKLAAGPQQLKQVHDAWQKVQTLLDKYPQALPVYQPSIDRIRAAGDNARAQADALRKQLAQSKTKGVRCDELDLEVQKLTFVSTSLDFVGDFLTVVRTVFEDKVLPENLDKISPALAPAQKNENVKFLFAEASKAADLIITNGPVGWATGLLAFAVDTAAFCKQREFAQYCDQFTGPMSATLHSDFYDRGRHYWSYDEELTGTLTLRFAKGDAGSAIHLTGEYEGNATRFTLWDDFIALYPKMASDVMYHRADPPSISKLQQAAKALGNASGRMGRWLVSPAYFSIPVEGDFVKDKITVRLLDATKDLGDDVKGKVIYIFVAPGAFIPETVTADAPYQKAQWIISRGIGMKPDFPVTVVNTAGKKASMIVRDFDREAKAADGSYVVKFKAHVKACNPECP